MTREEELNKNFITHMIAVSTSRDWTEDYDMDNGCYMNVCVTCEEVFHGHKRRIICKECTDKRV